jgi:hypothetical protein
MVEIRPIATRLVAEEILRNRLDNLVEVITKLVTLAQSLPEGEIRNQLFDRISDLVSGVNYLFFQRQLKLSFLQPQVN